MVNTRNDNSISLQATGIVISKTSTGNPANIYRNFIHDISIASNNTGAHINGLRIVDGVNLTLFNNIIQLGTITPAARTIYGIYDRGESSGNTRLYYNTVSITGEGLPANNNSYALWSAGGVNNKDYRNNIFSNTRSTAGSGHNYAGFYTTAPGGSWTADYNDYYASGTRGMLMHHDGTNYATLAAWQTATSQDDNSLNVDPLFATVPPVLTTDFIPRASMTGFTGLGSIMDDFANAGVRLDPVTMGAWENECNVVVDIQPVDVELCEGSVATFTTAATGAGVVTYQWQESTDGGINWIDIVAPAYPNPPYTTPNAATLTINPVAIGMHTYQYRCRISFTEGSSQPCVAYSNAALLTVNPRPTTSAIWHQ